MKIPLKPRTKEFLVLLLILFSGAILLFLSYISGWLFERFIEFRYNYWVLIIYTLIIFIFYYLKRKNSHRVFGVLFNIFLWPIQTFFGLIFIAVPFLVLQVHLIYYVLLSLLVPTLFYFANEYYNFIGINSNTYIYLILTFSVIIATLFNSQIKYVTYKISPFRVFSSEKLKKYEFKELTDYLISEANIRFLIYLIYFIYLLIFNVFNFENASLHEGGLSYKAVLQSFITFIALDSVLRNFRLLEFKPTKMLQRIFISIAGRESKEDSLE